MSNFFRILRYDWPLHFVLLITNWLPDNVIFLRLRGWLAHFFFGACGSNLRLGRGLVFYNPGNIRIGSHVYIAYGNWFSAGEKIIIQDEVMFGPKSIIASGNHTREKGSYRFGKSENKPILFGKGCWIGGNCTVTAGSSVGNGSLIGANTVIRNVVPDNVLFAGNPGKKIMQVNG